MFASNVLLRVNFPVKIDAYINHPVEHISVSNLVSETMLNALSISTSNCSQRIATTLYIVIISVLTNRRLLSP